MAEKVTIGNCELWHGDCRACIYSTPDHFCSHPETFDEHGRPGLHRHVWFVVMRDGNGHPGCGGRLFSARTGK